MKGWERQATTSSPQCPSVPPASPQGDKPSPFVTTLTEMKLDEATAFELQRHIQGTSKVPHHRELLKLLDLRA